MRTGIVDHRAAETNTQQQITVGSLLQGLTPPERSDLYIAVLIAEPDPKVHPSWHSD